MRISYGEALGNGQSGCFLWIPRTGEYSRLLISARQKRGGFIMYIQFLPLNVARKPFNYLFPDQHVHVSLKETSATGKVLHKPNSVKMCQDVWGSCQTPVTGTIRISSIRNKRIWLYSLRQTVKSRLYWLWSYLWFYESCVIYWRQVQTLKESYRCKKNVL